MVMDFLIGDPRRLPHPARGVGRLIVRLEAFIRPRFQNLKVAGAALCALTILATAGTALACVALLTIADTWFLPPGLFWFSGGWRSIPWFSVMGGGVLCGIWFSWRSLGDEAIKIYRLLEADRLAEARRALSMIVGRDTQHLEERDIVRAVVETVGENSVDGGIAPVFYALLGGPVLATLFKAASTLDSMVGYRNEKYRDLGMVSARLDDALNYIPARLSILLIPLGAFLAGLSPPAAFRIGLRDHALHPSPNSAWGESCFAGALGVQLGGPVVYGGTPSEKPRLGDPLHPLSRRDILRARRLLFCTEIVILAGLLVGIGLVLHA
ncbi:MAG: adenosylcobinamide-phosphate synthase CbiB [Verrucomicrobia bacterium]|nr:adenosylcobinamide-phosphate synthase CbiB [Verrucomicrobiota bacterium]MBU4248122.1 adenosylcobinamide-phosphate synthase CbiB [Verrucomicrobiota bacterium]MBU4290650.1 adenosylcobinamide-phosphate synthase CbiB [Verrucomicrobiota bacterium]MBU4430014.1 adenosylcobinamide-phosphate synthase CbiB [Verrucomicrobiota bacterium]MBU4497278.1 adenosylcobinamide-phosphate synthase CbiB [Verrucomicrobiota bacterium]